MAALQSEFFATMHADLETPQFVGATPQGNRIIFVVTGGSIKGPEIDGELLPGGGDWMLMRSDGVAQLDIRATIKTDDKQLIYAHYPGVINGRPEIIAKAQMGGDVANTEYYFRTTPMFETASKKYADMNKCAFVSIGTLGKNCVSYDIFKIL